MSFSFLFQQSFTNIGVRKCSETWKSTYGKPPLGLSWRAEEIQTLTPALGSLLVATPTCATPGGRGCLRQGGVLPEKGRRINGPGLGFHRPQDSEQQRGGTTESPPAAGRHHRVPTEQFESKPGRQPPSRAVGTEGLFFSLLDSSSGAGTYNESDKCDDLKLWREI